MSSTTPSPHANSFVISTAVINSHPPGQRRILVQSSKIRDYGPGSPPFWRTKESCKGLGSVILKINTQHTHFWRTPVSPVRAWLGDLVNRDPAGCSSAAPHTLSRMKCSEWAGGSRSLSHADGPLWAALLKTFRCDDACLGRLLSTFLLVATDRQIVYTLGQCSREYSSAIGIYSKSQTVLARYRRTGSNNYKGPKL